MDKFRITRSGKDDINIPLERGDLVMMIARSGSAPVLGFVFDVTDDGRKIHFYHPTLRLRKPIEMGKQVYDCAVDSNNGNVHTFYRSHSPGELIVGKEAVIERLGSIPECVSYIERVEKMDSPSGDEIYNGWANP
jgi:hypothetical protein